jgi:hypothetical protein
VLRCTFGIDSSTTTAIGRCSMSRLARSALARRNRHAPAFSTHTLSGSDRTSPNMDSTMSAPEIRDIRAISRARERALICLCNEFVTSGYARTPHSSHLRAKQHHTIAYSTTQKSALESSNRRHKQAGNEFKSKKARARVNTTTDVATALKQKSQSHRIRCTTQIQQQEPAEMFPSMITSLA